MGRTEEVEKGRERREKENEEEERRGRKENEERNKRANYPPTTLFHPVLTVQAIAQPAQSRRKGLGGLTSNSYGLRLGWAFTGLG